MKPIGSVSVPALILFVLVGALAGIGGYTFYYAKGASYFSSDPRACVNCHIMREQYDGWQKASHHAVATCNDCHTPHSFIPKYMTKAENGFWHSKGFTLQDFHEPIQIRAKNHKVLNENCRDCHRDVISEIAPLHATDDESMNCIRCHANVGHGATR